MYKRPVCKICFNYYLCGCRKCYEGIEVESCGLVEYCDKTYFDLVCDRKLTMLYGKEDAEHIFPTPLEMTTA